MRACVRACVPACVAACGPIGTKFGTHMHILEKLPNGSLCKVFIKEGLYIIQILCRKILNPLTQNGGNLRGFSGQTFSINWKAAKRRDCSICLC